MDRKAAKRRVSLELQCEQWNRTHPVGSRVDVRLDSGEVRETVTRSAAEVLSGHSAVIWLKGITGCYLLDRVRAVDESEPA